MIQQGLVQSGKAVSKEDIALIRETVELFGNLSRHELIQTICDHLGWVTLTGTYKVDACHKLLLKLEAEGTIRLPQKMAKRPYQKRQIRIEDRVLQPKTEIVFKLRKLGGVSLRALSEQKDKHLWNAYVERYHYLGYKKPIGYTVRYFVESPVGLLGCLLLSGASRSMLMRDRWIGWSHQQRVARLSLVISQSRFLILPWVKVPNLASHILGILANQVGDDYQRIYGFRPVLMETFVESHRFRGSCYRAAGWSLLGETKGRGQARKGKTYASTPKLMFAKPLQEDFRNILEGRHES